MSRHFHDFSVTVGQTQVIAVRDFAVNGPPVLLVHGEGSNLAVWDKVAELIRPKFHVISLDLPGHGASTPPPHPSVDADLLALRAVALNLGLVRPAVVGYLYGGTVAGAYRDSYPSCVLALAMTDPAAALPLGPSAGEQGTEQWRDAQVAMQNAIMTAHGISPGVFAAVAERMYQPLAGGGWERKPPILVEAEKRALAERMFPEAGLARREDHGDRPIRAFDESGPVLRVFDRPWAPLTDSRNVAEVIATVVAGP